MLIYFRSTFKNPKKDNEEDLQSQRSYADLNNSSETAVSVDTRSEVTSMKSGHIGLFTQTVQKRNVDFNFVTDPSQPLCENTVDEFPSGIF